MLTLGIDIGSLSTKGVVLEGRAIREWAITLTGPSSEESAAAVKDMILEKSGLSLTDIAYVVATGYGRINVPFAQATVTEISCHAKGSNWLFPDVRTILDMGGQDCKAIRSDEKGTVTNFALNDKCAAGTGRYLQRAAETLDVELEQIGPLSLQPAAETLKVSDFCAVFAERDIIDYMRAGKDTNDILAGAHEAITQRVLALLRRVGIEKELCISGGIAKNAGIVRRLENCLGLKALISHEPQIVGALGAALFAADRVH